MLNSSPRPGQRRARRAGVLAGVLVLGTSLLAGGALAQQKYLLREGVAVGDAAVFESTMDMVLDVRINAGGQEVSTNSTTKSREKYTETVLALMGERPSHLRRAYSVNRSYTTDPTGKGEQKVSSLQGKTVEIRSANGKVTVTSPQGKLAPVDVKGLEEQFRRADPHMLPGKEVGPGDEWAPDPRSVEKAFPGVEKAEVRGRFEEVVEREGHSCARIRYTLNLTGKPDASPGPLTVELTGNAWYALDLQRMLSMELSGPVSVQAEVEQDGMKLRLEGSGTLKIAQASQWLRVAGKPVGK